MGPVWGHFGPFLAYNTANRTRNGHQSPTQAVFSPSQASKGPFWPFGGHFGPFLVIFGAILGHFGSFWGHFGRSVGQNRPKMAPNGPKWRHGGEVGAGLRYLPCSIFRKYARLPRWSGSKRVKQKNAAARNAEVPILADMDTMRQLEGKQYPFQSKFGLPGTRKAPFLGPSRVLTCTLVV